MKPNLIAAIVVTTMASLVGCSHKAKEPAAAAAEKSAEPESRVKRGTNGEVIIRLDAETQKTMGLQTAALAAAQLAPEVKGYGRVLDPAALAATVADYVSAGSAAAASQKEFTRLKILAEHNNASARALETAEAALQRDLVQAEAARVRLRVATSKEIAARENLGGFVESLASGERALVRIDLPAGEVLKREPTGARLVTMGADSEPTEATFAGSTAVDSQTQGHGFLFLVEANRSRLAPGAAVTGFLKVSGDTQSGVIVPRNAVVRFNGGTWVYLQTGEETLERTEVLLDRPLEAGWFVREGLKPQDKVVTAGAQQLLSEELKGGGE